MLLDGKLCAMLGLMNGTEVVIEKLLLNDRDRARGEDHSLVQGNVQCLTHMPDGIIVRAPREKVDPSPRAFAWFATRDTST